MMKNKSMIAIILGIACAVVLTIVLIWNVFNQPDPVPDNPQQPPASDIGDNQSDQPDNETKVPETQPPVEQPDETDKPEPTDQPDEPDEPDEPVKPEPSTPSVQPNDDPNKPTGGKLNPDPKTAEEIKAVLNDPFMILVNRDHKVSSDYVPSDLVTFSGSDYKLNRTCAEALRALVNAGKKAGYSYTLYSGYRTYTSQYNKYYNKIEYHKNNGKSEDEAIRLTNQYYAPPGGSEHHTGLAADVCIPKIVNKYACLHEAYDETEEFKWFAAHAHEYGFILRYRLGDEDITGYSYEPWHFRYVGVDVATEIYKRDITFEEYIEDLQARLAKLEG